jgi:methionyl aminopeptidase
VEADFVIVLRSPRELEILREVGRITGRVRQAARQAVQVGMTTQELDELVAEAIRREGAQSNFRGYHGYPAHICVSVNDQVVHGIPGPRRLRAGDVVSVDLGTVWQGYHGDTAFTVILGEASPRVQELVRVTRECLCRAIAMARPGNHVGDISAAVEGHARRHGFGVVREYVGHGIGRSMHEEPQVPNYGRPGEGPLLRRGMVLAIEPMITLGGDEVRVLDDGWTVVTQDGSVAAHFEHTVAVGDPPEVLTLEPGEDPWEGCNDHA